MSSAPARTGAARTLRALTREGQVALGVYLMLGAFLLLVAAMGQVGIGAARMVFIAGSVAMGYHGYRRGGLPLHVEVVIILFVVGPFLRRIIDLHVGYDASGTMLIGPLLAMVVTFGELKVLATDRNTSLAVFSPFLLMIGCLLYGWSISAFQGNLTDSSIVAVKYFAPLLYCMCVILRAKESEAVLESTARAFLIVSAPVGLYGVFQHLAPPPWDQFWMISSKIPSIGQPYSGMVRVFGTMNSPVSFAAYATFGLLLFSFTTRSFIPPVLVPVVAILPLSLSIMLTSVRTAWISASISLLFCLLFNRTRGRAMFLIVCLGFGVAIALLFTSFGDTISDRFATFDNGANDGSSQERMGDYTHVFTEDPRYNVGAGLFPVDPDTKMAALDGQLLTSAVQMGTTVGLLHILGIVWAGVQALRSLRRDDKPLRLVAGALIIGNLAIIPLTSIAIGEIGFLFWLAVGVLSAPQTQLVRHRRRTYS